MADANIYSLLLEEEPVAQVAKKVQPAAKPSTKPAAKPASRPTTQGKKDVVRNKKPAPFKEGQFEEKPEHKGESRGVRHHKYEKPAHGRAYDRKSGTHPVKGGDKKEVAGASWGDAVESQLAAPVEEGQEETAEAEEERVPEPEESFKSLADYLQEKATIKPAVDVQVRAANDGKEDPKWKKLTAITKVDEDFVPAKVAPKEKKQKEVKQKVFLEIEQTFTPAPREGRDSRPQSGRGGFRGGRGGNQQREPREDRPSGRGGKFAGKPSNRGGSKGGAPRKGPVVNVNDQSAFPSLA